MNIGLGDCTPTPTVRDNPDGTQTVVYAGCPSEVVDVLGGGTNVYHDQTTGQVTVSQHDGMSTTTLTLIAAGIIGVILLSKR